MSDELVSRLRDYERWLTDGLDGSPSIGIEDIGAGETWGPAADRIEAQAAEIAELKALLRWVLTALHVLRGMCRTAGLKLGASKADEMIDSIDAVLTRDGVTQRTKL